MSAPLGSTSSMALPLALPPWRPSWAGEMCPFFDSPLPRLGFNSEEVGREGFWENRLHPDDLVRVHETLRQAPQDTQALTLEYRIQSKTGAWHWIRDRAIRSEPGGAFHRPGCILDISAEREALERLELYRRVAEILGNASGLAEAAPSLLKEIAIAGDWDWAELWTIKDTSDHLSFQSWWGREGLDFSSFLKSSQALVFRSGEGLPGRCWSQRRVMWFERLPEPQGFPRWQEAEACGFSSACCFHIMLDGAVIAIIECFSTRPQPEQPVFSATLEMLGSQLGQFAGRIAKIHSLKQSEARFRAVFDQASEGVFLVDLDSKQILEGNRAFHSLMGYTEGELKQLRLYDVIAHDAESIDSNSRQALEKGKISLGERNYRRKDGTILPVDVAVRPVDVESGALACVIVEDHSARKHLEWELRSTLKNLLDLQYAVDESTIFAVTDENGRILEVNRRFCEVSGYSREELLGKDHRIINSGYHPKTFFKEMWDTIKAGRIWRGEIQNRSKQGECYWVDGTIVPWLGPDGIPERYLSLRTVITDRKTAEEKVQRREEQMKVLLRTSHDLNTDLDIPVVLRKLVLSALELVGASAGAVGLVDKGKVRFTEYHRDGHWNPVAFEFAPGEGVPGHILETGLPYLTNHASEDPWVIPEIQRALGFTQLAEVPILAGDGHCLGCLAIHDTQDQQGFTDKDVDLLLGLADAAAVALTNAKVISERELHQRAMQHMQKMESLGVLAGGIAHDFNNLLTAIAGNVALAQLHQGDEQKAPFLENVDETVQRAADLTRQLLAYAGHCNSEREPLDLNARVTSMIKLLGVSVSKKARIHLELEDELPFIHADPGQIQQVIMNLVINASDALDGQDGDIRLSTRLVRVDHPENWVDAEGQEIPTGRFVALEVRDSGCGMPADVRARIFDPFFTTKATGRGLGLSALLGILRHHGAWIQLDTAPGQGTGFTLLFLPTDESLIPPEESQDQVPWTGKGSILLVDDEEEVRCATARLLGRFGFDVVEAKDGLEALSRFQEGLPFCLVLMDLTMPIMDGREASSRIHALDPDVKIVLSSGFHASFDPASEDGISAFLPKPFRWQDLNGLLKSLLEPSP